MIRFLTAGESHGEYLVAILEGIPSGLKLSKMLINQELERRQKGYGSGGRMQIEKDDVKIVSGLLDEATTGAPIALLIRNKDHEKWLGKEIPSFPVPRPGHADLTATLKYGYDDLRPALERASARETAARVATGAICKQFLSRFGIKVQGYVCSVGGVTANLGDMLYEERFRAAEKSDVRCPDEKTAKKMHDLIAEAMNDGETLGGVIEVVALGVPPGLGSHVQWDRKLDGRLGKAVLSIPAIKGIEIAQAFDNAKNFGTKVQDPIHLDADDLYRPSNNSGGIEGGISNGMPIVVRAAMKPIATTLKPQRSVNLVTGKETQTNYERSDFCPVPRAVPVVESMVAFVIADALLEKIGGDNMEELINRYEGLPSMKLSDFNLNGDAHLFWRREK
jgi:chorismate synthase